MPPAQPLQNVIFVRPASRARLAGWRYSMVAWVGRKFCPSGRVTHIVTEAGALFGVV